MFKVQVRAPFQLTELVLPQLRCGRIRQGLRCVLSQGDQLRVRGFGLESSEGKHR